jgi:hypothetical protein
MSEPEAFHQTVKSLLKFSSKIYLFLRFTEVSETKTFLGGNAAY